MLKKFLIKQLYESVIFPPKILENNIFLPMRPLEIAPFRCHVPEIHTNRTSTKPKGAKMKSLKIAAIVGTCALVAACAGRANSVAPVAVSATEFAGMSCEDTRAELETARERENALTRRQNNAATADAAGVFLVLLPLGSVFGGDVAGELAQAKGEADALERAVRANCRDEARSMGLDG